MQQDKAKLIALQADVKRYASLVKSKRIATHSQPYEQVQADMQAQKGKLTADETQINQAMTNLSYTKITAPIAGKTGSINFKVGDLVVANINPLLTINQLDPILVQFNMPQNKLTSLTQYNKADSIQIEVKHMEQRVPTLGKLIFIDNKIDPSTGTVTLKASLDNTQQLLWPGQIVSIKMILAIQADAIVIPSATIKIDQQGQFVYLFDQGRARLQRIKIDREVSRLAVISHGIQAGDCVLDEIPPNLVNGSKVKVAEHSVE